MVETSTVMLAAAAALAVLGFAWLALAMDTHWEQVHAQHAVPRAVQRLLRTFGSAALLVSLGLCLMTDHASMAALVWIMLLAGAAVLIAMLLAWRPLWLRRVWPATPAGVTAR